jgi:hypothetical protein
VIDARADLQGMLGNFSLLWAKVQHSAHIGVCPAVSPNHAQRPHHIQHQRRMRGEAHPIPAPQQFEHQRHHIQNRLGVQPHLWLLDDDPLQRLITP